MQVSIATMFIKFHHWFTIAVIAVLCAQFVLHKQPEKGQQIRRSPADVDQLRQRHCQSKGAFGDL
jgi:hypothetical protein